METSTKVAKVFLSLALILVLMMQHISLGLATQKDARLDTLFARLHDAQGALAEGARSTRGGRPGQCSIEASPADYHSPLSGLTEPRLALGRVAIAAE